LKDKQRSLRADFPTNMGLRVHRAISWIGRAENAAGDDDAVFVFYWIAFNSAYANEDRLARSGGGERAHYCEFFERLIKLDTEQRIYRTVWTRFQGPIRRLLENRYVFSPFWSHLNGVPGYEDWERRFVASAKVFTRAIEDRDSAKVLSLVFDRLYLLRNQMLHGGTTWNSSTNRDQVESGAAILAALVPVFVDLMLDHPNEDWGKPFYPVVNDTRGNSPNA
jgi:hypothetical protein